MRYEANHNQLTISFEEDQQYEVETLWYTSQVKTTYNT